MLPDSRRSRSEATRQAAANMAKASARVANPAAGVMVRVVAVVVAVAAAAAAGRASRAVRAAVVRVVAARAAAAAVADFRG
jgi:hypothetical protein